MKNKPKHPWGFIILTVVEVVVGICVFPKYASIWENSSLKCFTYSSAALLTGFYIFTSTVILEWHEFKSGWGKIEKMNPGYKEITLLYFVLAIAFTLAIGAYVGAIIKIETFESLNVLRHWTLLAATLVIIALILQHLTFKVSLKNK